MKLMQLSTKLTQLHKLTGNGTIHEFSFRYQKNKTRASRGPLKVYFTSDDGRVWLVDDYIDTVLERIQSNRIVPEAALVRRDNAFW